MNDKAVRESMVRRQIAARGVRDASVLEAMRQVPRELFVPPAVAEFAYEDTPLAIGEGQTISQPYIVAAMAEAARIRPGDRVLEVGTGSGYAAAVLSRLAHEVFTIERQEALARRAEQHLQRAGYLNVHVLCGDGTNGWREHAPYDAILVAAGGPKIPEALLMQLALGGRLVIPVGESQKLQRLMRVVRTSLDRFEEEDLGTVRFVPLIGAEGWSEELERRSRAASSTYAISALIRENAQRIDDIESVPLDSLLDLIGDARLVLLGEATHGTAEFYRMRARITRELVLRRGFRMVAVEADWPDAAVVDRYVRHRPQPKRSWRPFSRFPTWMWKNESMLELIQWLREYNREVRDLRERVSFHGLDLYSLYASAEAVISYLDRVDPAAARIARERYGCLSPWQSDPATYGRVALSKKYGLCEREVVGMLRDLLERRLQYVAQDGDDWVDALQNARLAANAERYYRIMYYGTAPSWNLRDQHMFDTLQSLFAFRGTGTKIVVWEHNSHIGDATATEMAARGEHNVGSLCRAAYGDDVFSVGFGTDHGTVAAASDWGAPMQVMRVRAALASSYEHVFHESGMAAGLLHLRYPIRDAVRDELLAPRLERAIGVVYRPETELESHYFQAVLPRQFDEYIWFDRTTAVTPLGEERPVGVPDTYPFGL